MDAVRKMFGAFRAGLDKHFSEDTASGEWDQFTGKGHCAVVSILAQDIFGGDFVSTYDEGPSHWFLRWRGFDIDLTGDQFGHDAVRVEPEGELYDEVRVRKRIDINAETLLRANLLATRAKLPTQRLKKWYVRRKRLES